MISPLVQNNERFIGADVMNAVVSVGQCNSNAAVSTYLQVVFKAPSGDEKRQNFIRPIRGFGHPFVAPAKIRPTRIALAALVAEEKRSVAMNRQGEWPTVSVMPFDQTNLQDVVASQIPPQHMDSK